MTKGQKSLLIKIIIIAIIIVVLAIVFKFWQTNKSEAISNSNEYLIVDEHLILQRSNNQWNQINEINDSILNNQYTVYSNSGKTANVRLDYASNQWFYMNRNYEDLKLEGVRLAYNGDLNIKLADYDSEYYNDSDAGVVRAALSNTSITNIEGFTLPTRKIIFDFDGDSQNEAIYTISNYSLSAMDTELYSTIVAVKNNEVTQIIDASTSTYFFVREVLDIDEDNQYEIIITKDIVDVPTFSTCYQIYDLVDGKWTLIKDCQNQ